MDVSKLPIVYDVGMNNGDDSEYYLRKGYRVIAVEANPLLCEAARIRFADAARADRITILNLGVGPKSGRMPFYLHKANSVLSTFVPQLALSGNPSDHDLRSWDEVSVDVRKLSDIIHFFGDADYIKIDIEGFDAVALKDLNERKIFPRYISAEAHTIEIFCFLVSMGYTQFKLINGRSVQAEFRDLDIALVDGGKQKFSFQEHSAGPFGEDIPGNWMDKNQVLSKWLERRGGWCDLHATLRVDTIS